MVHGGGEAATSDPPAKFRDVPIKLEFSDEHQATSALPLVTSAEASTQAGNDSLYPPVKFEVGRCVYTTSVRKMIIQGFFVQFSGKSNLALVRYFGLDKFFEPVYYFRITRLRENERGKHSP